MLRMIVLSQHTSGRKVILLAHHLSPTLHLTGKYDCTCSLCFFDASLDDLIKKQIMNHTGKIIQQFRPSVALIVHLKASWWPM